MVLLCLGRRKKKFSLCSDCDALVVKVVSPIQIVLSVSSSMISREAEATVRDQDGLAELQFDS